MVCLSRTYEELKQNPWKTGRSGVKSVYRVPMRNWNISFNTRRTSSNSSLSRTYEELKHIKEFLKRKKIVRFIAYLWGIETVVVWKLFIFYKEFIAYLWGIETLYDTIAIKEIIIPVYRVPMRNWNKA